MEYQSVIYEHNGPVVKITLNRPESYNSLSMELLNELEASLLEAENDDNVHVIVLKGAGRGFCSGYNISPASGTMYGKATVIKDITRLKTTFKKMHTIWNLRKPVIAQVHGFCLAGGTDLIGQCDIVIAAESSRFGYPGSKRLGAGIMANMYAYNVGPQWAKILCFTGDMIGAKIAEQIGLIAKAIPDEKLEEEVDKLAQRIAAVEPELVTINKIAINRVYELMGAKTMFDFGCELDGIAHTVDTIVDFKKLAKEQGLKAALEANEKPFKDLPKAFYDDEADL